MNPAHFCTYIITIIHFICFHRQRFLLFFFFNTGYFLGLYLIFRLLSRSNKLPAQEMYFSFPCIYISMCLHLSFAKCIMTHRGFDSLKNSSYDTVIWKAADEGTGLIKFLVIAKSIRFNKVTADVKMCYCHWISTVCKNNFQ